MAKPHITRVKKVVVRKEHSKDYTGNYLKVMLVYRGKDQELKRTELELLLLLQLCNDQRQGNYVSLNSFLKDYVMGCFGYETEAGARSLVYGLKTRGYIKDRIIGKQAKHIGLTIKAQKFIRSIERKAHSIKI